MTGLEAAGALAFMVALYFFVAWRQDVRRDRRLAKLRGRPVRPTLLARVHQWFLYEPPAKPKPIVGVVDTYRSIITGCTWAIEFDSRAKADRFRDAPFMTRWDERHVGRVIKRAP